MKIHPDILACHAQFGGGLEDMQRRYDARSPRTQDTPSAQPKEMEMQRVHSNYKPGFSEYVAPDRFRWVDVYAPATIFLMAFVGLAATVWGMLP